MLSVLMATSTNGDAALAMLPVARAFVRAGHAVTFLAPERHAPALESLGAEHVVVESGAPIPPPGDRSVLPGLQQVEATVRAEVIEPLGRQWATVQSVRASRPIDLVLTDPLFLGAALLALQPAAERPAVVALGTFPLPLVDPGVPPFGLGLRPVEGPVNTVRNAVLQVAVDRVVLRGLRRDLWTAARELTGYEPASRLQDTALDVDVWAQLSVPRFDYPRGALPAHVRYIGPVAPDDLGELPDWWFDRGARPIVHVCHVPGTDPFLLTVPAVRALALEDVLVVVTAGEELAVVARALGPELPENTRLEAFVPFSHLLAEARVVVAVPSAPTVHWALRWGVPLVAAGTARGQVEVGARITWSGAGVVLPSRRPSPEEFRAAVRHVLAAPATHAAAARIAAQIARTDPETALLEIAEELTGSGAGECARAS